jgi:hypothetical protein
MRNTIEMRGAGGEAMEELVHARILLALDISKSRARESPGAGA